MNKKINEILKLYKNNDVNYYNFCTELGYDKLLDYIIYLQEKMYLIYFINKIFLDKEV